MTNISTLELALNLPFERHDLIVAELDAAGFTGFVQEDHLLKAYIPHNMWTPALKKRVIQRLEVHDKSDDWIETVIAPQDWNKVWEDSIQPIHIPPFYVRPGWAAPLEGAIDIAVDPKMSFGTGHHETTRLLLKMMPQYLPPGCRILDAGTGTGILAIAAIKLNAASGLAFDFDPWVTENVLENLELNAVTSFITYREGTLDVIPESGFDVILANINRNVLLEYLPDFAQKLDSKGHLFLSGVLVEDRPLMTQSAADVGLQLIAEDKEGLWWAGVFIPELL